MSFFIAYFVLHFYSGFDLGNSSVVLPVGSATSPEG